MKNGQSNQEYVLVANESQIQMFTRDKVRLLHNNETDPAKTIRLGSYVISLLGLNEIDNFGFLLPNDLYSLTMTKNGIAFKKVPKSKRLDFFEDPRLCVLEIEETQKRIGFILG